MAVAGYALGHVKMCPTLVVCELVAEIQNLAVEGTSDDLEDREEGT